MKNNTEELSPVEHFFAREQKEFLAQQQVEAEAAAKSAYRPAGVIGPLKRGEFAVKRKENFEQKQAKERENILVDLGMKQQPEVMVEQKQQKKKGMIASLSRKLARNFGGGMVGGFVGNSKKKGSDQQQQ